MTIIQNINKKHTEKKENAWQIEIESDKINKQRRNHKDKEIVSRKKTQFDEVSEETAIRYLKELEEKYAPGSIIADVPSNKTGVNGGVFKKNKGNILGGQMILEVPVQKKGIPRRILEYAEDRDIQIRDTNGKIYYLRNEGDVQILE